jgi:hypothetical protein
MTSVNIKIDDKVEKLERPPTVPTVNSNLENEYSPSDIIT